ncbi:M23 family metallopeptidase [Geobacter sp. AOG2]|uniref:M23 family metallopeptidase n=1 Tax=Geobacter sp. AOG2 TaxID=1566347 RepID=UPI001CC3C911|nr:M23 family metallopeptidase [Geobacter sp. AOG2]GFE61121.1 peptidase M23 [Geobacter sp. AOG2]
MHKQDIFPSPRAQLLVILWMCAVIPSLPNDCRADIYRFVTVDGVESFTDAPQDKKAKVIIKEYGTLSSKKRKTAKKEKTREISLNEVVEKTVNASFKPRETSPTSFEPHLPSVGGTITSGVGMRIDPIDGKWRHHNGIDIAVPEGTPVTPVAPGVVVYSGLRSGYGYTVLIEHDNGMITLYGHNSRLLVAQGQAVDGGTPIALSGNTGRSTGPHLHFEAWQAGVNITPVFMPGSTTPLPKVHLASSKHRNSHFRKEVLADGSILFTNIPDSIP